MIIANIWGMINYDDIFDRWIRFGTMGLYFLLFISPWFYNKKGLLIFVLFLISDGLLINYEDPVFNAFIFIIRGFSYLLLAGIVIKLLRDLKTNFFQKIVFTIAFLLNIFLLYSLVEMIPSGEQYSSFDFLFYFYGISIIACVTAAVSYSNRYANKPSLIFLGTILCLVFSDLSYFIGFYLNFSEFFIVDRIFNFLGIALLLHFMLIFGETEKIKTDDLLKN